MVRKLYKALCILCIAAGLTSCGEAEEVNPKSRTIENFVSVANNLSLPVVDACEQYKEDEQFKTVYIAVKPSENKEENLWQIEHYTVRDEVCAKKLFEKQTEEAQQNLNSDYKDIKTQNSDGFCMMKLKSDATYFRIEQIGNILILAKADIKYEEEINSFFDNLNVH